MSEETKERKASKRTKLLIAAVVLIVVAVVLVMLWPKASDSGTQELEYDEIVTEPEDPGIPVETKYMTFSYPTELENAVTVEQTETDTSCLVSFYTNISDRKLELFTIVLSQNEEDGYELGVLSDETDGEIHVFMQMNEQSADDWTEEEFAQINTLQERVNDIIIQFHQDARFTPSR